MSFPFPKEARLRTSQEFKKLGREGVQLVGRYVILSHRHKLQETQPRLGITVSRRYGKAHLRNRFKRQIREAFRLLAPQLATTLEIHVLPRKEAIHTTTAQLIEDFVSLLQLPR
jgi:ribonuclease P protein component